MYTKLNLDGNLYANLAINVKPEMVLTRKFIQRQNSTKEYVGVNKCRLEGRGIKVM